MAEAFPRIDGWAREGREEEIQAERDRYKRERDDLLQALFQPRATRNAVAKRILGETDSVSQPSTEPVHSRQGE